MSDIKANACPPSQGEGPGASPDTAVNIRGCTVHEQILTPIYKPKASYKPADAHVSYTPTQGVPPSSLTFELLSFAVPLALIVICFGLLVFFDRSK